MDAQLKKIQMAHREELAEANAQVQLAKSKTVTMIEAKRDLGLRYQKCVGQRKELELKNEKIIHDNEQLKRIWESEKKILNKKIRTIEEKTTREMQIELTKLSTQLETAHQQFNGEREHHQSTHAALEQCNQEIETLVLRLAVAQEHARTPIDNHHHHSRQQVQQHSQQQHSQQVQQQHSQQQHVANWNVTGTSPMHCDENVMSLTFGGASINHRSLDEFETTFHSSEKEENQQNDAAAGVSAASVPAAPLTKQRTRTRKSYKNKNKNKKIHSERGQKTSSRPQSAGRKRSSKQSTKQSKQPPQDSRVGRPPLPPTHKVNDSGNDKGNDKGNDSGSSSLSVEFHSSLNKWEEMEEEQSSRLDEEEEEGVDLEDVVGDVEDDVEGDVQHVEEISSLGSFRSMNNHSRVQNILDDDSGMESPGQRAAAAIAGAMDFVKSRTQKRRERRFDDLLGS